METKDLCSDVECTEAEIVPPEDIKIMAPSALEASRAGERVAIKAIDAIVTAAQPDSKFMESIMNDQDSTLEQKVDCANKYRKNHGKEFRKDMLTVAGSAAIVAGAVGFVKKIIDEGIV